MKKFKQLIGFSVTILFVELLCLFYIAFHNQWLNTTYYFYIATATNLILWLAGCLYLFLRKPWIGKSFDRFIRFTHKVFAGFLCLCLLICVLVAAYPYTGGFYAATSLFSDKDVMIIIPHQDDEINLAGGLIEQYTGSGSDVTVVFTTNGDRFGKTETRAKEVLSVLTHLGVEKDNIYYLAFGDGWNPQWIEETPITHIYNAPDPDGLWTSIYGTTATYGTSTIDHYLDLSYTRNHYLLSLKSLIAEKRPDTIFAVDFDSHLDHRAASLFFEEAMGQVLQEDPTYTPTVYKGFAYGTAWYAESDFLQHTNLVSTQKPKDSIWEQAGMGYRWEERLRFPLDQQNLNRVLSNNSVYDSLNGYPSQKGRLYSTAVLNGDKVFWERRTDSLLYQADILVDGQAAALLNDFKRMDYPDIANLDRGNTGVVYTQGSTVRVTLPAPVTADSLWLYDNHDPAHNVLAGTVTFSDGSVLDFGPLNPDGGSTAIPFPEKEISWLEISVTQWEGEFAGLCEVELYSGTPGETEAFLMPLDISGNFVYDYMVADGEVPQFRFALFPRETPLNPEDVHVEFVSTGPDSSCSWQGDTLAVQCAQKEVCSITVSAGSLETTFTVSNPGVLESAYINALRNMDRVSLNLEILIRCIVDELWLLLR